ncbi:GntR family transcriptional regulator [Candidatus Aerophobetes bacterium Ae_b3a]|nr:MAG: GntR family transcriptional regulator [Candidatus Aerophobetes bacterium Ae_b3a]
MLLYKHKENIIIICFFAAVTGVYDKKERLMVRKVLEESKIPLYHQIKEDLRARIEEGEWLPGKLIPPEKELCAEYKVSKITVLEAIKGLVREGLIKRKQGKGTFVAEPKLEQSLNRFYSFTESIRQKGFELERRILGVQNMEADKHTAKHLGIKKGEKITEIVRLRLVNGEPLYLETIIIPVKLCPNLHLKDIGSKSLNDILRNEYKISLIKAKECFEPIIIDDYEAQILGVKNGVPALLLEHTTYTTKNQVVLFSNGIIRGDRCRYYTELE